MGMWQRQPLRYVGPRPFRVLKVKIEFCLKSYWKLVQMLQKWNHVLLDPPPSDGEPPCFTAGADSRHFSRAAPHRVHYSSQDPRLRRYGQQQPDQNLKERVEHLYQLELVKGIPSHLKIQVQQGTQKHLKAVNLDDRGTLNPILPQVTLSAQHHLVLSGYSFSQLTHIQSLKCSQALRKH